MKLNNNRSLNDYTANKVTKNKPKKYKEPKKVDKLPSYKGPMEK